MEILTFNETSIPVFTNKKFSEHRLDMNGMFWLSEKLKQVATEKIFSRSRHQPSCVELKHKNAGFFRITVS